MYCTQGFAGPAFTQGFSGHVLYAVGPAVYTSPELYTGLYRPCNIRRDVEALHCTVGCIGSALYTGLYRTNNICSNVHVLHYM